jgi:hypothetical protein
MLGKRIIQGVIVLAAFGLTGCCRWCERHCCQPATCCQPAAPMYAPQPTAYQAPACCPTSPAYPAPVGYQPSYSQWQRPVAAANGCCE